jgi:hypothetical protein
MNQNKKYNISYDLLRVIQGEDGNEYSGGSHMNK